MPLVKPISYERKIKVHNNPVVSLRWESRNGFTLQKIQESFNETVKKLQDAGHKGEVQLLLLFPTKTGDPAKWRYVLQHFEDIDSNPRFNPDKEFEDYWGNFADLEFPDLFKGFEIQITKYDRPQGGQGGRDSNNDCLYNCLHSIIPDILTKAFPTPASLKKYCGVNRHWGIPLDKIKSIEEKLPNCKIEVQGEYTYHSIKPATITIPLNLWDEHYEINKKELNRVKGIAYDEKTPAIFKYLTEDPSNVKFYDGKTESIQKLSKIRGWQAEQKYSSPYILIKSRGALPIKDQYAKFIANADVLKEKTNGKYNLYKCGCPLKAVLNRFYELNPCLDADIIEQLEAEWLSDCHMGGLIWAQKGYEGPAYKYDINSAYPTVLLHHLFSFPIKKGTFKRLTKEEFNNLKFFEYGIYKVKITNSDHRLIPTTRPKFTHFDLERAKELGYTIEIIEDKDNSPNVLSYAGANVRVNGSIFKQLITELFALKKSFGKDYPIFKETLLLIWGGLCERNKDSCFVKNGDSYTVPSGRKLKGVLPYGKNRVVKMANVENPYNTPFARLGPFLLSRVRCMVSRILETQCGLENVVRVYTDGIISKTKLTFKKENNRRVDFVKIGTELGDIRYEGYNKHIYIHGPNRVDGLHEFQL